MDTSGTSGTVLARRFFRALRSIVFCMYRLEDGSFCGERKRLEFAHIKETPLSGSNGRGMWSRMKDIQDHPDCYLPLCPAHHLIKDGKNRNTVRNSLSKSNYNPYDPGMGSYADL